MFADLESVDWAAYTHCYGPATDLPGMLRSWVGGDPTAREDAVSALWGCLFHQGDLHPTATVAAPFFVEALRHGNGDVFADAYFFVDHMLAPQAKAWEADGFEPASHESPACYWAAAGALDVLVSCIEPGRRDALGAVLPASIISRQVCQTLLWFPQSAGTIAQALLDRLSTEVDPNERVPLLLCLAMQDRHLNDPAHLDYFAAAARSSHPGECLASVMALARLRRLPTTGDHFDALRSALESPLELAYPEETQGTLATGEQLVGDALLAAVFARPLVSGEDPSALQHEVSELVADRAFDDVEELLKHYGV